MNREIKFEYGFNSQNGIVKKVYHLSQIPKIEQICDVWNDLPICYVRQFTGLKDKNGKEIYEGDIVTYIDYDSSHEDEYLNKGIVEYYNDEMRFTITNRNTVEIESIDFETEVEVIGSIYENPELLKSE